MELRGDRDVSRPAGRDRQIENLAGAGAVEDAARPPDGFRKDLDMKNDSNHPARSPDFLSRLHDGDLTAGERAHFESHRAHCGECRRAASEFEKALSLFRATSTSAPPSDLSARILRKLQASTPRQARFGIVHGINMKWAAGFAVAVIAAVVGFSVVLERESARREILRQTPIPVLLEKEKSRSGGTASVPPRLDAQ